MAFDISFSEKIKKNTKEQKIKTPRRCSSIEIINEKTLYRRCFGEVRLLEEIGLELKENHSYHFITGGDI